MKLSHTSIKFALLAIVVILVTSLPLYSQTRPRQIFDQPDHPESTQSVSSVTREANLTHSITTTAVTQTDQISNILSRYTTPCQQKDNSCLLRKLRIRAAALKLINLLSEDNAATIPNRRQFEAQKYATQTTPNFGSPVRRAPLRRKGRTQH